MPGYLYFALKCMQHKWPQKKKKKKKKKTTLRCYSFPHLHEKLWSRFTCFTILLFPIGFTKFSFSDSSWDCWERT